MNKHNTLGGLFIGFLIISAAVAILTARENIHAHSTQKIFETSFDKNLPYYGPSVSLWGWINYTIFNEGKPGVIIGDNGWLFTAEEFETSKNFQIQTNQHFDEIISIHKQLTKDKVKLLILPIPAKVRIHADQLGEFKTPKIWHDVYPRFLIFLERHHIFYVRPPRLSYFQTDTHWTQESAHRTAHAIAAASTKKYPYLTFKTNKNDIIYGEAQPHSGDLLRYIKGAKNLQFNQDTIRTLTLKTDSNQIHDLFSDEVFDIALVGTSYSAKKEFGFELFLKNAFQSEVLNVSDEGQGPFTVMENYLKSDLYNTTPKPKLIIWEIPERYLPRADKK